MTTPRARPVAPYKQAAITRYLSKRIEELSGIKTQREIAIEVGYDKPQMISMFKNGERKSRSIKFPYWRRH
jgi:hypothetical protein